MDFARKQLEKYGWTEGKGLGKNENGISQALKPKLKRSVTGVGYDSASEFNKHWWSILYDKAASNLDVKNKKGTTKKIKTKNECEFIVTNSTWKLKRKQNNEEQEEQYSEYFVRTAVLTNGGSKIEKVKDSESLEDGETRDVFKMTDEELFIACEGRTAHKGARHGLKAIGKLARLARQEAMLLTQPKYIGYSHAKIVKEKIVDVEEMNLNSDSEVTEYKKKKKRKFCNSLNNKQSTNYVSTKSIEEPALLENNMIDKPTSIVEVNKNSRKRKNKKRASKNIDMDHEIYVVSQNIVTPKKKKKRNTSDELMDYINTSDNDLNVVEVSIKKSKKKTHII